ncbi:hypothetical protein VTI74DRAFT_778 [Chaetomium olivicolor]
MANAALSAAGLDPTAIPNATPRPSSPTQPTPLLETFQHPAPFHTSLSTLPNLRPSSFHGLLSSHLEYTHFIPLLSTYNLLLVDLPGHSNSFSTSTPPRPESYSIASIADAVAGVIRTHAKGGKAHIVGLSMGGFVGLELARRYPELCSSAWVTGSAPFEGWAAWLAARPGWIEGFIWVMEVLPDGVYNWLAGWQGLKPHGELREEMRRNRRWEVIYGVYRSILAGARWEEVKGIEGVRVLTVAGGKQDDVEATRKMGRVWTEMGREGCKAAVVRGAVHSCDLQMPEVFAEGVRAWVEGRELPREFEVLE